MKMLIYSDNNIIVYRMGRLCGGAHEISSIKAPLFLCGWVGRGGGVGGGVSGGGGGGDGVLGVLVRDVVGGGGRVGSGMGDGVLSGW